MLDGEHIVFVHRRMRRIEHVGHVRPVLVPSEDRVAYIVTRRAKIRLPMEGRFKDRRLIASEDRWMRIVRKLVWIERTSSSVIRINDVPRSARLGRKQTLQLKIIKDRNILIGALPLDVRWIDQAMTKVAGHTFEVHGLIESRSVGRHGSTTEPGGGCMAAKTQVSAEQGILIGNRKGRVEDRIARCLGHHAANPIPIRLPLEIQWWIVLVETAMAKYTLQ